LLPHKCGVPASLERRIYAAGEALLKKSVVRPTGAKKIFENNIDMFTICRYSISWN